jgi:hypothetical protein
MLPLLVNEFGDYYIIKSCIPGEEYLAEVINFLC